ncbi:MAG TPA: DUF488 domain-containing protein [Ohtaekwangia sp.]
MNKPVIYTIGHSIHQLDYFLELLQKYSVNCIVDVRSTAASRYNPQYNKKSLANFLADNKIRYMHFPEAFGARQIDPALLDENGQVDFEKVRRSQNFKKGVEQLREEVEKQSVISLMCAESDPLVCHRFSMISVALQRNGFDVIHIIKDKTTKSNTDLEYMLLNKYDKKIRKSDIFTPEISVDDQLKMAYRLINKEIGYLKT